MDFNELKSTFVIIEITSFALPMGVALLLSFLPGGRAQPKRRRDRDWDDEYDDDRDRRVQRGRRDRYDRRDDDDYERDEEVETRPANRGMARDSAEALEVELVPEEPTTVHCPACKKHLAIPAGNLGKSVRCPACQQVFVAEAAPKAARIECPQCRKELRIPESALGKSVKCPSCQAVFTAQARQEAIQARSAPPPPTDRDRSSVEQRREHDESDDRERDRARVGRDRGRPRSSAAPWIVAAVIGGLLLVVLVGVIVVALLPSADPRQGFGKTDVPVVHKKDFREDKKEWKEPFDNNVNVKRPPCGDALARKIVLNRGSSLTPGRLEPTDPLDRGPIPLPAKIYLVALAAEQAYFVELKRQPNAIFTPHLRVEELDGRRVSQEPGKEMPTHQQLFIAPKSATYRLVVTSPGGAQGDRCAYVLSVKQLDEGDTLPPGMMLPQTPVAPQSLVLKKKLEPFLGAAIAHDSKSAYIAFPKGKLQRLACPSFEVEQTFELPKQSYQMVVDRQGKLYAMVQRVEEENPPLPWLGLGPADLYIYDMKAAGEGALQPAKVLPLDGIVMHMMISPDDNWLYYLDKHNNKVGRVDITKQRIDTVSNRIAPGTNSLCLTPDGKALFSCSNANVVQRLNPRTLAVERTINIDKGKPTGIQATDRGHVFLNSGEGAWTNIWYLNATRDYGTATAAVLPWAGVYQTSHIRLAPDQKRLYTSCFNLAPGSISSFAISARPGLLLGQRCGDTQLDPNFSAPGRMEISPDGTFLFCDRGAILSLGR